MIFKEHIQECNGHINMVVRKNGQIIDRYEDHNLIVTLGRQRMAELLSGLSSAHISHIVIGTGKDVENIADTTLQDLILIPLKGAEAQDKVARFNFLIDAATGNGLRITEFGLFASDGVMFSHRVRTGIIEKADDIEIEGYWEIRF